MLVTIFIHTLMQHTMDLQSLSINQKNNDSTKLHSLGGAFNPLTIKKWGKDARLNSQERPRGGATYTGRKSAVELSLIELKCSETGVEPERRLTPHSPNSTNPSIKCQHTHPFANHEGWYQNLMWSPSPTSCTSSQPPISISHIKLNNHMIYYHFNQSLPHLIWMRGPHSKPIAIFMKLAWIS